MYFLAFFSRTSKKTTFRLTQHNSDDLFSLTFRLCNTKLFFFCITKFVYNDGILLIHCLYTFGTFESKVFDDCLQIFVLFIL